MSNLFENSYLNLLTYKVSQSVPPILDKILNTNSL